MKRSIYFLIITIFLLSFSQQSFAYQLFGYKWAGGAYNYYINPIGVDNSVDYSSKSSTIISAAAAWQSVSTTDVQTNYLGTTSNTGWGVNDGVNVVTWKTDGWSGSVIGLSISWYSGNEIIDSDIKLNTAFANDSRMSQLVTHEVGHSLGIGHTRESGESYTQDEYDAIMYWLLHSQTGLNRQDKCAITAIYPASGSCSPTFAAGYFTCMACCADDGSVSVTITDDTYTYSGTAKNVTVTTSPPGLAYAVTYSDQLNNVVASPTNVGVYNVQVDITEAGYESEGPFYGTLTINKKTLSVSADNKNVDYGDPEPSYTYSISGFVSGENTSDLLSTPIADIVEAWPVDPGVYTIYASGGTAENYSFSYQNGTLTVNGLSVNNVWVSDNNYNYDGTNKEITVTTDPPNIGNIVEYKLNNVIVPSQINAAEYDVTITIDEPGYNPDVYLATMNINKAPLNAVADDKSVIVGDPEPNYTISYNGFVNNEDSTTLTSLATADIAESWPLPAGNYTIISSGATAQNYNITHVNGTLTVTAFSVDSVTFDALTYTYDGQAHYPTITTYPNGLSYSVVYKNSLNVTTGNPTSADSYHVEVTITEPGYIQDVFDTTLTIEKVDLAISIKDTTIVYGVPEPNYTFTFNGFVNNETEADLNSLPVASTGLGWPLLPSTYFVSLSGGLDTNYNYQRLGGFLTVIEAQVDSVKFSGLTNIYDGLPHEATVDVFPDSIETTITYQDSLLNTVLQPINAGNYLVEVIVIETGFARDTFYQTLQINKANLIAQATNLTVDYADPEPQYKIAYSGFVNNEDSTVIDSLPTAKVEGTWPLLPGNYPIEVNGGGDNNYTIHRENGLLTVKSNGVILSISDTVQTYNGLAHEAAVSTIPLDVSVQITYFDENNNTIDPPTLPGTYKVHTLITEVGYEPQEIWASFVINKAMLTVNVQNETINYGETLPEFTYSISGYVNGETEDVLTGIPAIEITSMPPYLPGDYILAASGGNAENYDFTYENGTLSILPLFIESIAIQDTITTYSGLSQSITAETIPEELSYSISWFKEGQLMTGVPRDAGSYHYVLTINEAGYFNSAFEGSFSIEKALLSVRMDTVKLGYGDAPPSFSLEITGFVNDETTQNISELPTVESITDWPWNAGKYSFEISGGTAANYAFQYEPGVLIIDKSVLTIQVDDASINYGDELPEFNYTTSGFQFDDDISVLTNLPQLSIDGEMPLQPGNHTINASGADATNYTFEYLSGNLWVEPIGSASFIVSKLDTSYTGLEQTVSIETEPTGLSYLVNYSETPFNAGTYAVEVVLTQPGYLPLTETYEMHIGKAELNVSVADTTIWLGDEEPEYTIAYEGFVNGEDLNEIDQVPAAIVTNNWSDIVAGAYPIYFVEGSDNNYEFSYHNGVLTVIQTYWIKVIAGENGNVSQTTDGTLETTIEERVPENGNSLEYLAIADDGYNFTQWDNGSTMNPITFENVNQDMTITALFEQKVGVDEFSSNDLDIKVFPNPVEAMRPFNIKIEMPQDEYNSSKILITDMVGRIIFKMNNVHPLNEISGLRRGVYTLTVQSNLGKHYHIQLMIK